MKIKIIKKILKLSTKMNQKIRKFDETEIEEYKFHKYKSPFLINNIK